MKRALLLLAIVLVACIQNRAEKTHSSATLDSDGKASSTNMDQSETASASLAAERVRDFEAALARYGKRFGTPQDAPLTSFVLEQVKASGRSVPEAARFVLSRRDDHWVVSVVDLNKIREGRRVTPLVTYHVADKDGLMVIAVEPGI